MKHGDRHAWLDGSIGLSSHFGFRWIPLVLCTRDEFYWSRRYILRVEIFGLYLQIGCGLGVQP